MTKATYTISHGDSASNPGMRKRGLGRFRRVAGTIERQRNDFGDMQCMPVAQLRNLFAAAVALATIIVLWSAARTAGSSAASPALTETS